MWLGSQSSVALHQSKITQKCVIFQQLRTIAEEIIRKLDYSIRVEAVLKNEDGQMLTFKFVRVVQILF